MQGVVIASHGPMAQGILETSKLFVGEQAQLVACCLYADTNPDDFVVTLEEAIKSVDTGDGVVVLCDMLFGSPCNCMMRIIGTDVSNDKLQVLTGVNLAMTLQVLSTREANTVNGEELVNAGKEGVADLKAVMKANM